MKKRESNRNLRLRALLIILLICAIVFISSTYAWFTSNKEVSIQTIEVSVKTSAGIQISADGENWKSALTVNDIIAAATAHSELIDILPTNIEPVSTDMSLAGNGTLNMFYGEVKANADGEFALQAAADAPSSGAHYVVFDIFLKTNTNLGEGKVKINCSSANAAERSGVIITGAQSSDGIQNASRIAFVKLGNIEDGSTGAQIRALGSENASNSDTLLWEPNADTHTAAAVSHASSTYGITTQQTGADVIPYDGVKAAIQEVNAIVLSKTNATDNSTYFGSVTPDYSTGTADRTDLNFFSLDSGITKVRVYMWVEGQDVDCENNASGATVDFNLMFKLVED